MKEKNSERAVRNAANSATKKRRTKEKNPMGTSMNASMGTAFDSGFAQYNDEPVKKKTLKQATGTKKSTAKKTTDSKQKIQKKQRAETVKKTNTVQKKDKPIKEKKERTKQTETRSNLTDKTPKKRIASPKKSNAEFDYLAETEMLLMAKTASQKTQKTKVKTKKTQPVKIVFLGGVGEIGKNMTALEYGDDIIIIDAGLTFPNNEDMPGIDSVVPDITYLIQNKNKIKGVLLTHGHEDHIGGVPYLMKELNDNTPIYGTRLTLMLTDNKLQEHHVQNTMQRVVVAGDRIKLGAFEVEFINVNHSISGACALAIRTPNGLIYHSGDYKIDLTPVAGAPIDLKRIAEIGQEGVLLCMCESTNIERPGYTMSETVVGETLNHLFAEHTNRRLIIATFASNVHRLQQIIDLAVKYRRKVALSGRSMFKVVEAAVKIGELKIPEGVLIDIEKTKNLFDGELLIVSTGSQGEPMSALTRMASGDFNKVTIGENDTIIISANPIPGNEKMIYRVINNLYKKGAHVVYESLEKIHVSGHACQEEHKVLYSLLNPKFFIPVHGEYRHLKRFAQLVETLGMPERNILIPDLGNCVELTPNSLSLGENVQAGAMLVDGEGMEDYGTSEVMKDRLKMSADGVVAVSLAATGNYVINEPVIETHGCMPAVLGTDEEMQNLVKRAVENYDYENGNKEELALQIRRALKNYFYRKTKQAPLIIVTVLDV